MLTAAYCKEEETDIFFDALTFRVRIFDVRKRIINGGIYECGDQPKQIFKFDIVFVSALLLLCKSRLICVGLIRFSDKNTFMKHAKTLLRNCFIFPTCMRYFHVYQ